MQHMTFFLFCFFAPALFILVMDRLRDIIAGFSPYSYIPARTRQKKWSFFFDELHSSTRGPFFIKNALYLDKHLPTLPALFHWILSKFPPHSFSFPFKLKTTEQRHVFVFPEMTSWQTRPAAGVSVEGTDRQSSNLTYQLCKIFDKYVYRQNFQLFFFFNLQTTLESYIGEKMFIMIIILLF